jgi:hypothetical protein
MNDQLKTALLKHAKILGYLFGSGLCAVALIKLADLPPEYGMILAGAINYIAYALEKELKDEGVVKTLAR